MIDLNTVHCADIFDLCARMDDASVELILCDLPYGTTQCKWDEVIPFKPMWAAFGRIIKPRGAIVLTAAQPFTSALVMSNPDWFRYDIIWHKSTATGHLNAKKLPMREHEEILVFGKTGVNYYPQIQKKKPENIRPVGHRGAPSVYGKFDPMAKRSIPLDMTYPRSVIRFSNGNTNNAHSTQKPVALFEYLIRTYTQEGELVFDPCCGSGTTAVAAKNTGRKYIVGDSEPTYIEITNRRLTNPVEKKTDRKKIDPPTIGQLSLFDDL